VERHIQNLHNGNGQIVSFVDYIAGRQAGIYHPGLSPTYVKKSSVTSIPKTRSVDIVQNELLRALAWKSVNNKDSYHLPQQTPLLNQQEILSNQFQAFPMSYYYQSTSIPVFASQGFVPRSEDIFGFEMHLCDKCSTIKPIMICYSNEGDEGGQVRIGITCCNSIELPYNSKKVNEVEQQMFVKILKDLVDLWTTNNENYKNTLLVALKLSSDKIITGNHKIKVKSRSPARSITLQCLEQKYIELTNTANENYWAVRAIERKKTTLNDHELRDFLTKVKDATFGFFKIDTQLYLMAITNNNNTYTSA
jgi:hypothetical protein